MSRIGGAAFPGPPAGDTTRRRTARVVIRLSQKSCPWCDAGYRPLKTWAESPCRTVVNKRSSRRPLGKARGVADRDPRRTTHQPRYQTHGSRHANRDPSNAPPPLLLMMVHHRIVPHGWFTCASCPTESSPTGPDPRRTDRRIAVRGPGGEPGRLALWCRSRRAGAGVIDCGEARRLTGRDSVRMMGRKGRRTVDET